MKQEFFCGLDLGQSQDYTAVCVIEKVRLPDGPVNTALEQPMREELHLRHIERLPLGTSYPVVVQHVKTLLESPALKGQTTLAIDHTGVGRPIFDLLSDALPCQVQGITITGGDSVSRDGSTLRVPKRDLIGAVQVFLQNATLKIASTLPHAQTLVNELLNFKVKIDPLTAHDSYSAWRENQHDDLVLAVSMACWMAAETQPIRFIKLTGI
jgi:hypothetical protein